MIQIESQIFSYRWKLIPNYPKKIQNDPHLSQIIQIQPKVFIYRWKMIINRSKIV